MSGGVFYALADRMRGMSTNHDKPSNKSVVLFVALMMVVVPLLYVLSSGPTLVLVKRGQMDSGVWQDVYRPVIYAGNKSSGFSYVWQWYLAEWTERPA